MTDVILIKAAFIAVDCPQCFTDGAVKVQSYCTLEDIEFIEMRKPTPKSFPSYFQAFNPPFLQYYNQNLNILLR